MIVVTGAAGFIPSCLVASLNNAGHTDILLVDDFSHAAKEANYKEKKYTREMHRDEFPQWLQENGAIVEFVFHLGARTDTTEFDTEIFDRLNLNYSKAVWNACVQHNIPLVYASSAATYGMGELGYKDDHDVVNQLKPLNPYGDSKNDFDKWVLGQNSAPPFWAGLKFFNVYGPNEFHKSRMASVVFHAFNQIKEKGTVNLFASHHVDYKDGEQLRDFIFVKDVASVMCFLMEKRPESGLYNLGTGKARTFVDLAKSTFAALGLEADIRFIPTPEDIRDKYQYYTQADMGKLISAGYDKPFHSLEDGIRDYVQNYLSEKRYC